MLRVLHLGFEVRVEVVLGDGREAAVQLTRDEVEQLDLESGQIVFLRPRRATGFARSAAVA